MLARRNLKLKGEKCIFAIPFIEFLGFRLMTAGLSPLHFNFDAVLRLPEPSCPAQLSSFLGIQSFLYLFHALLLRDHCPVTSPLQTGHLSPGYLEYSAAICQLKAHLTSPPVLADFDLRSPLFVTCDISN